MDFRPPLMPGPGRDLGHHGPKTAPKYARRPFMLRPSRRAKKQSPIPLLEEQAKHLGSEEPFHVFIVEIPKVPEGAIGRPSAVSQENVKGSPGNPEEDRHHPKPLVPDLRLRRFFHRYYFKSLVSGLASPQVV